MEMGVVFDCTTMKSGIQRELITEKEVGFRNYRL